MLKIMNSQIILLMGELTLWDLGKKIEMNMTLLKQGMFIGPLAFKVNLKMFQDILLTRGFTP